MQPLGLYIQNHTLKTAAFKVSDNIYGSWVLLLSETNLLKIMYINNGKYWCNKVSTCEVHENKSI